MAKKWKDLTEKQKKQFGGNKKAFKEAKKQVKKSGGNAGSVLQIKNAYKAAQTPSPPPAAAPAPPPPAAAPSPPPAPAPSFKQAVKDLGDDGKINNKDFKELVENYGEKKVTNNLVKVADKNDIKIGNRPSEALGIKDQPAKTEPAKAEPTFKETVKELAKDGKISNADYNDLKEQFGDKKVDNKLAKVADKNDIKIGKKPSKALGISKPTDKKPKAVSESSKATQSKDINALRASVGLPPLSAKEAQKEKERIAQDKAFGDHAASLGAEELNKRINDAGGYRKYRELFDKGEHEPKKTSFKEAVKELAKDGKISNADYNDLKEQFGEKKVGNKLVKVADKNDIKIGKKPSKALGIDKQPDKTKAVETEPAKAEPTFKEAVKELAKDGKISNADYNDLKEQFGDKKVGNKLVKVADKNDIKIGKKPSKALGIDKQPDKTEAVETEAVETDDKPSFKEAVKELGSDGKINNKDYKELVDTYGEKKVGNKLEKVTDKNDIKIGNKPSQALGIKDQPAKTEPAKPEDTDDKPSFKEAVKELGSDGKINNKDYKELVDAYGDKKVDNKLVKVADKNDIKIGNKPSQALGIDKPEDTDDRPSFKEAVKDLGSDGKINNKDYQELVDTYGEKKVGNKLEKVTDKNDIKIGNRPSEALGINKPEDTDDKRSLEDAIIALGSDRKINNEDYKTLVAEFGSESVNNKLGNIAGENDIKIGKKPSKELEDDKAVRQELGLEKPEQSPPPPDVKKTGEGAFRKQIDKYYEDAEKKYTNRMGKFAADYRDGLTRYKGKKDESGRNKIQREYKDKRSEDAKAYDRDKSQFQKDKLNSLYAQRRDLLDDKGMVKRPSLDASTTPNPYEGAISEIKQALGIQKPNANYLKDQVKNSLTMKIKKPSLDLNIKGAESNAPKFKTKQFTRLDRNYKPRT